MIKPWMFFAVIWVLCAVTLWKSRAWFPKMTETAVIFGWIILGFLGVGLTIGFVFGHRYVR